jgi:hypothetical protein
VTLDPKTGEKVSGLAIFGRNVFWLIFFPDAAGRWGLGVIGGVVLKKKFFAGCVLAIIPMR